MKFLITGGAGFIGSTLIRYLIANTNHTVLNVDKLTYASNLDALKTVTSHERYHFKQLDICNQHDLQTCFMDYQPDIIMHLAAESHVDRSILSAQDFIQTNIIGTYLLLELAKDYWQSLSPIRRQQFRFHHISTDEVYGDLDYTDDLFTENTPYSPSSPYSASKASSDHLVRAWQRTYGLPTLITNCSNNYGPYQHTEKLIPHMIINALKGQALPVYGDGNQIRDWIYVDDHVRGLYQVVTKGRIGETYNLGGECEKKNIEVINTICDTLQTLMPIPATQSISHYRELITSISDRLGHDKHYAMNISKIKKELEWSPEENFDSGLKKTIVWYLNDFSSL